jgi:glycosyltransferase involved in cell wall biosynthesis
MTRVLMLDPSLFTLPYDRALCAGLATSGCQVHLVGRRLRAFERSPADAALPLMPHFYRLAERASGRLAGGRLQRLVKSVEHVLDMVRVPALCDRLRPDVIHVQWLALPMIDRRILPALRRRAPLILTVHNSVPFHGAAASRLQMVGAESLYDQFDQLIAHTPTTRRHLLDQGVDARRIASVAHGLLPLADEAGAQTRADDGLCRVLFFGELKPYKGLRLLIEAIAALPPATRAKVRLQVAGRPRMELAPLVQLCHEHGFAEQVTWDLRFIRDAEIARLFGTCDVVALPYHDVDSSGVLTLATVAGKAVIASEIGGFRDLLKAGETALLAPLDAEAFARELARLVETPALRRQLADNLRRHGHAAIPTWSAIGRTTLEVYGRAMVLWRTDRTGRALRPTPHRA